MPKQQNEMPSNEPDSIQSLSELETKVIRQDLPETEELSKPNFAVRAKRQHRLTEIIRDYYNLPDDEPLSESTTFAQDLGADSLDSMELLMLIEDEYDVNFGDQFSLQSLKTIGNATDKLCEILD